MKYIRTKDGIEKLDADREHLAKYMNGKQVDTIEELCDEFVVVGGDYREQFKKLPDTKYLNLFNTYGAIWTDKGLIYVAKMNDEGELELL